jgi:hypothetical protein
VRKSTVYRMKKSSPPPRIKSSAPRPIPTVSPVDPVAGIVGVGLVVTVPPVPPVPAELTVIVWEQLALPLAELVLSPPALSVRIAVALYVPGLLNVWDA